MNNFEFYNPIKMILGRRTKEKVGKETQDRGFKKVLTHLGGTYLYEGGTLDQVYKNLSDCGIGHVNLGDVVPNPRLDLAKEGIQLCREEGIDFILATGGGSSIDFIKGIAYGLANDFGVEDLLIGRFTANRIVPFGCIFTIVTTGSKISSSTIIIIEEGILKRPYNYDHARLLFATMNPELTYTLPPYQTASGTTNIMMHVMEYYFTNMEHVGLTNRMAKGLLVSVCGATFLAVKEPDNYDAQANLMRAGSLSHNGLTGTGRVSNFAPHKIEYKMSGVLDAAHGVGLCAIWGGWARYVYKVSPVRFAQFAVSVSGVPMNFYDLEGAALEGIEAWKDWCHRLGIPTSMTKLGIRPTGGQIEEMAERCVATGGGHVGFSKAFYKGDVISIYHTVKQIPSQNQRDLDLAHLLFSLLILGD